MFDNVGRSIAMLGGAAGLTLCLAGGVAVGVVPQVGGTSTKSVVAGQPLAAVQDAPAAPVTEDTVAPPAEAPPEEAAPVDTTVARSRDSVAGETTVFEVEVEEEVAEAPAETAGPAGPTTAARLSPSSAQVKAAIAQIGAGLPISEAQARQFGNSVCDAFDQGQSFSAVKATALAEARKVPFVSVSPAQVDSAVRSAVQLFCPGYSSQI